LVHAVVCKRDVGWESRVEGVRLDVRHALRALRRSPGFATVAILTLALGVGANITIFSVSDALLLHPLPYPDSDRLVALRSTRAKSPTPDAAGQTSPLDLADWQAQATSFEALAGYRWRTVDLTGGAYSERLRGLYVTPEYFDVFGIANVTGRTFRPEDRKTNVIVLGRGVWERRFSADRSLIGSTLDVNMINLSRSGATPHRVLGVVPADVHFPPLTADFNLGVSNVEDRIDFWLPLLPGNDSRRDDRTLDVVGRLRPGVSLAQAQADMDAVARHLAGAFPATNRDRGVQIVPLRAQIVGGAKRVVLLLSVGTVLVLLIACGNVSTLLLVRGLARQREIAVRSALGAGRARIARHLFVESLLIASVATTLGVGATAVALALVSRWLPANVPFIHHVGINKEVLAFAVAVASLTACLAGLVPAWISSAREFGATGLSARGQSASRWQQRAIAVLTAAQVALTLVLLVSTGLLLKSAARLWRVDPGFNATNILTMTISLPNNKFDWQHNVVFSREVLAGVKTLPTVRDAAVIQGVPMRAGSFWTAFAPEGLPPTLAADLPVARLRVISAAYFRVMQIPLLDGRAFDERDDVGERGHPRFVIVNRALAARYWPGESAVGKRLQAWNPNEWVIIAGVVGDVRYTSLDTPPDLEIYLPDGIFPEAAMTLLAKTTTNPLVAIGAVRARVAQVDREAFVTDVRSMDDLIVESLSYRWFATLLVNKCAVIGLALALSGIYGVVAQAAVQRKLEIGIRMALGATQRRIVGLMLQRSAVPVAVGVAVGLLGAIWITRLLSAMLFGIRPIDPATFAAETVMFAAVALLAAVAPALRATKVDPLVALRCE
jgi:putative ABC transport system permease protein